MRAKDKLRYRYPCGESYLDVIQRLEPVIIEMEREKECVCVVAHQAVLRAVIGYFTNTPLEEIPNVHVPLHTLIELRPNPDGTMQVEHIFSPSRDIGVESHADIPFYPTHLPPPGPPVQVALGVTGEEVINRRRSTAGSPSLGVSPRGSMGSFLNFLGTKLSSLIGDKPGSSPTASGAYSSAPKDKPFPIHHLTSQGSMHKRCVSDGSLLADMSKIDIALPAAREQDDDHDTNDDLKEVIED